MVKLGQKFKTRPLSLDQYQRFINFNPLPQLMLPLAHRFYEPLMANHGPKVLLHRMAFYILTESMDTALELRVKFDQGIKLSKNEIDSLLERSNLRHKLTNEFKQETLFLVWRTISLSEIPYSLHLDYTQKLINTVINKCGTSSGFSLTGNGENLLPCYNAILIKAFCKLGLYKNQIVENGINWILKYQAFSRNFITEWDSEDIHKYGGCLNATPCYIGLTKSVIALHEFNKYKKDTLITDRIKQGIEYILKHRLFRRLSNGEPISKHILDLYFPENYNINILELLLLLSETDNLKDPNVSDSMENISRKKNKNLLWGADYVYKANGYISFDGKSKNADWVSYFLNKIESSYYS